MDTAKIIIGWSLIAVGFIYQISALRLNPVNDARMTYGLGLMLMSFEMFR